MGLLVEELRRCSDLLLGQWVKDIKISNWERVNFAPVVWAADGNSTTMNSCGEGWEVSLTFGNVTFQECRTYIE